MPKDRASDCGNSEAQIRASLNHPNIAAIYGIEESEGTRALVLELVEGPTLADRISKGPIPLDEALPIAKQIAEALEEPQSPLNTQQTGAVDSPELRVWPRPVAIAAAVLVALAAGLIANNVFWVTDTVASTEVFYPHAPRL